VFCGCGNLSLMWLEVSNITLAVRLLAVLNSPVFRDFLLLYIFFPVVSSVMMVAMTMVADTDAGTAL